jgi:hypothetical protein
VWSERAVVPDQEERRGAKGQLPVEVVEAVELAAAEQSYTDVVVPLTVTAVQFDATQDVTSDEPPLPPGPPCPPLPTTMNLSSPDATYACSCESVSALSDPVKPPIDITARPVLSSICPADVESETATSQVAEP